MGKNVSKKKGFHLPHTFIILVALLVFAVLLTWIVPAGEFDRIEVDGRQVVDPNSFHPVERNGQGLFDLLMSIPQGFTKSANVNALVFICGAFMYVVTVTGAINSGLGVAVKKAQGGKQAWVIAMLLGVGCLLGLRGAAEGILPYIPIAVSTAIVMGYDSLVGFTCLMVGGCLGFATNWIGTNYIVATGIAGISPLMQDVWYRLIIFAGSVAVVSFFLFRYAKKINRDPTLSPQYAADQSYNIQMDMENLEQFTTRHKIIVVIFIAGLVGMILGGMLLGWKLPHFAALYFGLSVLVALISGMSGDEFAEAFIDGCKTTVLPLVLIMLANSVSIILQNGKILDTISYGVASLLRHVPRSVSAIGMFLSHCLINILIPSASGQAAATMPIMVPIGDIVGLDPHVSVLAFQFGDCLTNSITPTAGFFMAGLGMAGISWETWAKWYGKILAALIVYYSIMVTIAVYLPNYPNIF